MIFKYNQISISKYKDIKTSPWFQQTSQNRKVTPTIPLREVVEEKPQKIKRGLTGENLLYLQKRLKTDFSV